jgi:catalase
MPGPAEFMKDAASTCHDDALLPQPKVNTMNDRLSNACRSGTAQVVLALGSAAVASAGAAEVAHETPASMVGAFHTAFGAHHARAVHAKGIILQGMFTPAPEARTIARAALFSEGPVPVTVRFSDFTGLPDIPDTVPDANPRGFAVKFRMGGGRETDIVTHSFNGFPVATVDEFAVFLRAIGSSGPEAPKPTPIEAFLGSHPIAKAFVTTQKPPPVSYATAQYFGVNSFAFLDASGKKHFVRYRFVPVAGEHYLDAAGLATKGPDYLREEIATRVAKAPAAFEWFAQMAEAGDAIENPSVAWPESRKLVHLGTISIRSLETRPAADKELLFLPGRLCEGIETADPMLTVRHAAYPISFGERQ